MRKFDRRRGSQIRSTIDMLKGHDGGSFPILSNAAAAANDSPIISIISISIAFSICTDFLLSTQGWFDIVRMQIAQGFQMRQSNDRTARNRLGNTLRTGRNSISVCIIVIVIIVIVIIKPTFIIRTPNPPKGIGGSGRRDGRDNLLSAAASQILAFAAQKMFCSRGRFGFQMTQFDGRSARHQPVVAMIII